MTAHNQHLSILLAPEFEAELNKTRRTLERLPDGKNDFRPHPKSKTLLELANHIATVAGLPSVLLVVSEIHLGGDNDPRRIVREPDPGAILSVFNELAARSLAQLKATSDEAFAEPWQASAQGKILFSGTRYLAFRNIAVNHLIHHRAQLGVYLRALDIPVPSTFGPSADEPLS